MSTSAELMDRAVKVIPGGVNSPVRAFGSVGLTPRFIERADGPYLRDVEGNRYLDYVGSWGPMILGHNHPAVREAVQKACERGLSFGAATELEQRHAVPDPVLRKDPVSEALFVHGIFAVNRNAGA